MSGQYGGRDAACPVSTGGGTRRVRSVRGEGRGVSGQYVGEGGARRTAGGSYGARGAEDCGGLSAGGSGRGVSD